MYIGNSPADGENNSFKILDDITSYTLTFNGSSASVVSLIDDTIAQNGHRFVTGQRVTYTHGGGTTIGGLTSGSAYYIIKSDQNTVKLALTLSDANNNNAINLTSLGTGSAHTLNVAFDGINTKFVATYDNGTKAQMTRAAQLQLSVNGVIQQPQGTAAPTNGFGIDVDSVIVFSVPPVNTDVFWGNLVANNFPTFDISDNAVDSFTGNGSQTDFTLSKTPANSQNVLVTIDGVVQYPSDTTNIRAYSVSENVLSFVSAPGNNVAIQVRHIGFAGATSSAVTGFYGRTGNVVLTNQDHITVGSISSVGNINSSGIITATSFVGDGSSLTGIAGTANVRTNSLVVSGVSTLGNTVVGGGTTQLIVTGNARITGILTIGTSSITLDGSSNQVNVGTGVTLHHTNGVQVGGNTLHSTVLTVNQINASGVITATTFSGALTGNATGLSGTPNITVGTIDATSLNASGVVTATSFSGSGANLTGIGGTTDVRTNSLVVSGVSTFANVQISTGSSITVGDTFIRRGAVGLGTTSTVGRNAGVGTAIGTLIYNATTSAVQFYSPVGWITLASAFVSTGGTKTTSGSTTIHTFNSTDTLVIEGGPKSADYLIVAGGGGGNNSSGVGGGGGGAGGFRTGSGTLELNTGTYTMTIGAGGVAGISPGVSVATRGIPSSISSPGISSITSQGGGAGGGEANSFTPGTTPGGSGGGGTHPSGPAIPRGFGLNPSTPAPVIATFPTYTPGITEGNNGADAGDVWEGGGGGGAGGAAPSVTGGTGSTSSISGSPVTYGGGGGGGRNTWQGGGSAGTGGSGGGGPGGNRTGPSSENPGTAGTANRGGGGGGGGRSIGAAGGSGIIIISYPT